VLTIANILSELGGFQEFVFLFFALLTGYFQSFLFQCSIVQKVFLEESGYQDSSSKVKVYDEVSAR